MSLPPEVSRVWPCIVGHGEVCLISVCVGGGIRKQLYVVCSVHMIMMIIMIIMMMMIMMMSIHSRF